MTAGWVSKQDAGTAKMQEISNAVKEGAYAFLSREYKTVAIVAVILLCLIAVLGLGIWTAIGFMVGTVGSALAGFVGMWVTVRANVRTTQAAHKGLQAALGLAFKGGSVTGVMVVGLGIIGLAGFYFIAKKAAPEQAFHALVGLGFGCSLMSVFARIAGGIYTKAADVGADLVGKVEAGIPEDDPRNPAVIADNVGDNVGDCAGMAADLFETYLGTIIATMPLGASFFMIPVFQETTTGLGAVLLPLMIAGVGIIMSIVGTFFVRVKEGGDPQKALNFGNIVSGILMIIASWFLIKWLLPESWLFKDPLYEFSGEGNYYSSTNIFFATVIGILSGSLIGMITEYFTGSGKAPVLSIVRQSLTGAATNIIAGLSVGMLSTALPVLVLAIAIILSFYFGGLYGIAIAAFGMLSNTGIQLAVDAYGPISDNAGGIAEMAELPKEVRERTDKLDAVGNTTAAIGKGFAIASAALTALALFAAFMQTANLTSIDVSQPKIMAGLLVGGMLPFVFSALSMNAVGRAAMAMIEEVRRQFRDIPQLKAALVVMKKYDSDMSKATPEDRKIFDA